MSGFEVLGLILGIYPVIGHALKIYRATRNRGPLKWFVRSLEVEKVIFAEFVHNLLASELSEVDLVRLRDEEDPSNLEIWNNKELLLKVGRRLGPETSKLVLSTLLDINDLLKTLRKNITSITVNEQGDFTNSSRFHGRLQVFRHNLPQSSIRQSLDDLKSCNAILQRLLCDRAMPFTMQQREKNAHRRRYLRVDCSYAVDLYHALHSSFQCACTRPHPANLRLHRLTYDNNGHARQNIEHDGGQFELLLALGDDDIDDTSSIETAWSPVSPIERPDNGSAFRGRRRTSSISIQEYTASESVNNQPSIDDLCSFARGFEDNQVVNKASLRFGLREKNYLISRTPGMSSAATSPTILCVHDFLSDSELPISRQDRMGLALRLSHIVLQFYSTPWIDENWTWKDFAFAGRGEYLDGKHDTSQLFVSRKFYSTSRLAEVSGNSNKDAHILQSFTWSEPILTRLGFALIELALGASFVDLRSMDIPELRKLVLPSLNDPWINTELLDRETAYLLLHSGRVRREEGLAYEEVVKACLERQYIFESTVRGLKSDGPSFLEDVERCILAPLYEIWEKSWGQSS